MVSTREAQFLLGPLRSTGPVIQLLRASMCLSGKWEDVAGGGDCMSRTWHWQARSSGPHLKTGRFHVKIVSQSLLKNWRSDHTLAMLLPHNIHLEVNGGCPLGWGGLSQLPVWKGYASRHQHTASRSRHLCTQACYRLSTSSFLHLR